MHQRNSAVKVMNHQREEALISTRLSADINKRFPTEDLQRRKPRDEQLIRLIGGGVRPKLLHHSRKTLMSVTRSMCISVCAWVGTVGYNTPNTGNTQRQRSRRKVNEPEETSKTAQGGKRTTTHRRTARLHEYKENLKKKTNEWHGTYLQENTIWTSLRKTET